MEKLKVGDIKQFTCKDGTTGVGIVVDKILGNRYDILKGKYILLYTSVESNVCPIFKGIVDIVDYNDIQLDAVTIEKLKDCVSRLDETINLINKRLIRYKKVLEEVDTIKNSLKLCRSLYKDNLVEIGESMLLLNKFAKCRDKNIIVNSIVSSLRYNTKKISKVELEKDISKFIISNNGFDLCSATDKVLLHKRLGYTVNRYINLSDIKLDCTKKDNIYNIVEIPTIMYLHRLICENKDKVLYLYVENTRLSAKVLNVGTQVDFSEYRYLGRYECSNVSGEYVYTCILDMLSK